ncbi:hypothetical protein G7Y89_g6902 [Cudoniella acicularis]|uniref:Clr5 domain-containing protein n=1 Tax=Cudoniella acicularis TaxID=354080 RepID=A0A8H4RJJ1_9HELO|nr:hypothetical protein G7Y89_g6902 [Cudoniella acicularis]
MPKNWSDVKRHIHTLYVVQHRPLNIVVPYMKTNHNFKASPRAYREKLKEWGYLRRNLDDNNESTQREFPEGTEVMDFSPTTINSSVERSRINGREFESSSASTTSTLPLLGNSDLWTFQSGMGDSTSHIINLMEPHISVQNAAQSQTNIVSPFTATGQVGSHEVRDEYGRTSLHRMISSRSWKDFETSLASGAAVNVQDSQGNQPLHDACKTGLEHPVHLLLKHRADSDAVGESGQTPLHMAVRFPKVVKLLLESNATVSVQDDYGNTPLHLAVSSWKESDMPKKSAIHRLIQAGANVNVPNAAHVTPFHMILEESISKGKHHASFVLMFLENNADIFCEMQITNCPSKSLYKTPNIDAKGACVDFTLQSGDTFISEALKENILSAGMDHELGILLFQKADINNLNLTGTPLLHQLMSYNSYDVGLKCAKICLDRGADVNQADRAGKSPLLTICDYRYYFTNHEFVQLLLSRGADAMQRDLSGTLPIYAAIRSDNASIGKELEVLHKLLDSGNMISPPEQQIGTNINTPKDQEWWNEYYDLLRKGTWCSPKHLLETKYLLPNDIVDKVWEVALTHAAKTYLESSKVDFKFWKDRFGLQHPNTRGESNEIVAILRDCREFNIKVDESWYHFLLELFE